jgi:peptidoglycan/LPS O-acetylase OafA/YrhL
MRIAIVVAVFAWLLSVFYLLISGEDGVIFFAGIIIGLAAVVFVAVAAIRSGRRDKRMWSE